MGLCKILIESEGHSNGGLDNIDGCLIVSCIDWWPVDGFYSRVVDVGFLKTAFFHFRLII